ncbi:hypothetical protein [Spirillospora sp. NPDC047279]|uniref:hypothetical protein n=1 Tax=Spirillospora sp. NPDC047279 TaxID=3155478 RepID=UPI003409CCFD
MGWTYGSAACASVISDKLAGVVCGRPGPDVSGTWEAMVRAVRNDGRPGAVGYAISAVDVALWDLKARLLGLPLHRLLGGDVLDTGQIDQRVVESFQRERFALGHRRHGVPRRGHVVVAEHRQRLAGGHLERPDLGSQHRDQRGLAPDQSTRDIEAVLGQQRIQVVTRDPPRDVGIPRADQRQAVVTQRPQPPVDPVLALLMPQKTRLFSCLTAV